MSINGNTTYLCAMTVDVEDYYHVAAFGKNINPDNWEQYPSRVVDNTHKILDLFESKNITATFFILGWVAERQTALVQEIHRRGHEIASHGYSHQLVYNQTPEVFEQETIKSKNILEDIIGQAVKGYRASSYSITHRSLWALDVLGDLGFEWDSSIFPIRHDKYGIADSPTSMYNIITGNGKTIREIPMTTASLLGMRLPAAGGGYFRLFPYSLSKYLLKKACKKEPGIFYLHPWEIDPEQPRVAGASLLSRFRHYNNLDVCYARLQKLIEDVEFDTVTASVSRHTASTTLSVDDL